MDKDIETLVGELNKTIIDRLYKPLLTELLQTLEIKKVKVMSVYGVDESVGVDISIGAVKEIAKRYGVEVE